MTALNDTHPQEPRGFRPGTPAILIAAAVVLLWLLSWASTSAAAIHPTTPASSFAPNASGAPTNILTNSPAVTPTASPACGLAWRSVSSPNVASADNRLEDVSVVSPDDVWAVGYFYDATTFRKKTLTEHWDGAQWSVVFSPNVSDPDIDANQLYSVEAVSANDVWAVGTYHNGVSHESWTLIEHWDGSTWSIVASPNQLAQANRLYQVQAISADDVWAVGSYSNFEDSRTLVEHWDGSTWAIVPSPNFSLDGNSLNAVAVVSSRDVWAVGSTYNDSTYLTKALVEHWDGVQWTIVPSPNLDVNSYYLFDVEAVSANDVWAVGSLRSETLIEHWDGTQWTIVPSPNRAAEANYLFGVEVVSADDVWAVGDYGDFIGIRHTLVVHWDGTQWSIVPGYDVGANSNSLGAVAASSAGDLWAVGYYDDDSASMHTLVERYTDPCLPTPTATSTPTSTPVLVGHVTWQGRPAQPNALQQLPITLTLKSGTVEMNYPAQTTDSSGYFTVSVAGLANGTYEWRVKGHKYLANSGTAQLQVRRLEGWKVTRLQSSNLLTFQPSNLLTSVEMGQMQAGDCDDDNRINAVDFNILKRTFGRGSGDPDYDERAEFTGDNQVNILDFNLIKLNFGAGGAPPIRY